MNEYLFRTLDDFGFVFSVVVFATYTVECYTRMREKWATSNRFWRFESVAVLIMSPLGLAIFVSEFFDALALGLRVLVATR